MSWAQSAPLIFPFSHWAMVFFVAGMLKTLTSGAAANVPQALELVHLYAKTVNGSWKVPVLALYLFRLRHSLLGEAFDALIKARSCASSALLQRRVLLNVGDDIFFAQPPEGAKQAFGVL
ncbi:hypothetical protein TYRP_014875 [Tyrophagus putrescentiae]|nr:hypothetical protein TYRP_014875 [Tyrophagus putrescentiae]